jgi:SSS family solute:Na+ symporter
MMSWIDWMIVLVPLVAVAFIAFRMQKYSSGVAEFMAGGRLAGRYLVCNARGEMGMAVVSTVAMFELFYEAGFTISWWQKLTVPLGLFVALTGYVIYRYRETRAMTLAQFFEIRYSKSFRLFAGMLVFASGLLNYGIFPAVSSRFFVYFCGLPQDLNIAGIVTIPIEGMLSLIMLMIVLTALMIIFDWSQIQQALSQAPPGKSMLNPFDIGSAKDFNIWYVLIGMMGSVYGVMAWQGSHAFNSCAKNAHEAKMGAILGTWRGVTKGVMISLLAICAVTYLKHPDFAAGAANIQEILNQISNPQIQTQMRMPLAINFMLPVAIKGMMCSIMLFGLLAGDSSYMHSWGSIFIQDIVLPFKKKLLSPEQHIRILRWAIVGVAVFGFFFSLLFRQTEYILMFFALTGAIFLGGAGSIIAGGLYWKKGTTAGAWAAMISGSGLAVSGIILQQCWKTIQPWLLQLLPDSQFLIDSPNKFPVNGQVMYFWTMVTSILLYIIVSLLTCRKDFNMEKMLHRGQYAIADDQVNTINTKKNSWRSLIGIDQNFTRGDKAISISVFSWTMFWWVVFVIVTVWNLISPWSLNWWSVYWKYYAIIIPLVIGMVTTVWFVWGGVLDLKHLFKNLKVYKPDDNDDGTVVKDEQTSASKN